jgi:hypothetical protein
MRQINVVSTYPRSKLHAEVYIRAPQALKYTKGLVLLLLNSLYRLKQSGREWYIEACTGLKTLGFNPYFNKPSIFTTTDCSIIIGLYIDDILVLGRDPQAIQKVINGIAFLWEIKDLGDIALILGIRVYRDCTKRILYLD